MTTQPLIDREEPSSLSLSFFHCTIYTRSRDTMCLIKIYDPSNSHQLIIFFPRGRVIFVRAEDGFVADLIRNIRNRVRIQLLPLILLILLLLLLAKALTGLRTQSGKDFNLVKRCVTPRAAMILCSIYHNVVVTFNMSDTLFLEKE
uniref:Uncharacterized protein n=1 Tax=Trichogramma kaykai TaxID=54128 RepID=A0ABD2WEB6_9HYME